MVSLRSTKPELDLVVRASAPTPAAMHAEQVTDWSTVRTLAQQHRVLPRVWRNAADLIPAAHQNEFRAMAAANAQASLHYLARTIEAVQVLEGIGVEAIVLKGPLLSHRLYGDYGLRTCTDVDLLVQPAVFARAAQSLGSQGYRHQTRLDAASLSRHRRSQHDVAFVHPDDDTLIELHVDLAQPHYSYRLPLPEWWRQRRRLTVGGQCLSVLNDEQAFLLGVLHGAKHHWHRLDLISDTAAHARLPMLDWPAVDAAARQSGMARALGTALALAECFYGDTSTRRPVLVRQLAERTLTGKEARRWTGMWLDLQLRERLSDRLRYLYGRALRPSLQALQ